MREDLRTPREACIRYLGIIFFMGLLVITYVWQNIEVMKIKIFLQKDLRVAKELQYENDRLRYEIEKGKKMSAVEEYARLHRLRSWSPRDIEVIVVKEEHGKKE